MLFGVELPRHGITSDLVAQCAVAIEPADLSWVAGRAIVCRRSGNRLKDQLAAFWHDLRSLWSADARRYDAIQVRDKVFAGILGLIRARQIQRPFIFWMSFPMSEGFIELAHREKLSLGVLRWLFVAVKGHLGKYLVYRYLLPRCDHVFVQSERMANDLERRGIRPERMTPVPMGIDLTAVADLQAAKANRMPELAGRRVIAYLGKLEQARRPDVLLEAFAEVRRQLADAVLLLIGGAPEAADEAWLKATAAKFGVADAMVWTGWVPTTEAWSYLRHASVAVSIVPRGELFDCASPTKVVEYLALGIPVVANDQPDQHRVLTESGAGISVAMDAREVSDAILRILRDSSLAEAMNRAGPPYVATHRNYALIGDSVAHVYQRLWTDFEPASARKH